MPHLTNRERSVAGANACISADVECKLFGNSLNMLALKEKYHGARFDFVRKLIERTESRL